VHSPAALTIQVVSQATRYEIDVDPRYGERDKTAYPAPERSRVGLSFSVVLPCWCPTCCQPGRLEQRWPRLKQIPVVFVNGGDSAVGVFQEDFLANDVHDHKTATRLVAVDAADGRSL
jgi:hypothetical protein